MPSPADRVTGLYQRHATAWEQARGRDLVERDWLDAFVQALPEAGREILDLGCGTGMPVAGHLITRGCRITGIDGAPALIERAQALFPQQRWLVADMRRLPPLGPFHGVIAWHSFFHLTPDDQGPMFDIFRRMAAPGAALMFTSGTRHGEAIGTFEGEPLYHGSLAPDAYRALLQASGFRVLRHVETDPSCGGATVWLAQAGD